MRRAACGGDKPVIETPPADFNPNDKIQLESDGTWSTWTKYLNPVFSGQYPATGDPSVLREGNMLRMYYSCFDPAKQRPETCLATSVDGLHWKYAEHGKPELRGQILEASKGGWRDTHETPFMLKFKGQYHLYFSGYIDKGGSMKSFPASLGLSVSSDPLSFSSDAKPPIMKGTPQWYDKDAIFSPSIVNDKGKLYMVYAGHCWTECGAIKPGVYLLGASSTDGVTWTKHKTHLFDGAQMPSFFKEYAGEPELIKGPDGYFYLFFSALQGDDPHMIGVARSPKPFGPWEFNPKPIVVSTQGRFDASEVVAPSVLIENGKVRLWFAGFSKKPTIMIGYAEAPWPLKKN